MKTVTKEKSSQLRNIIRWALLLLLVVVAVIIAILRGYFVSWSGFGDFTTPTGEFVRGKTVWDWMQLLVIPLSLLIGGYILNRSERDIERLRAEERAKLEREIANDRQQESALQAYLDRMADLLLKEKLLKTNNEEVRNVARIRTLTVLRGLDARRKGLVVIFLHEAGLINKVRPIVGLNDADLSGVNLEYAFIEGADLSGADLSGANLSYIHILDGSLVGADLKSAILSHAFLMKCDLRGAVLNRANLRNALLQGANLRAADLIKADLKDANLTGADLKNADLKDANLQGADLKNADLEDATMPDGTQHD